VSPTVPDDPSLDGLEAAWDARWEADGTYRFDRERTRAEVFAVDTAPVPVSGPPHLGHVVAAAQADVAARYRRMRGYGVFQSAGWDDAGVATERMVQDAYGLRWDPGLPHDPSFEPPSERPVEPVPASGPDLAALCRAVAAREEEALERLWRTLGFGVDWSTAYSTVGERARRASQRAFLRSLARGEVDAVEAPTLWDVDLQTAVAHFEVEEREVPGSVARIRFHRPDGGDVEVETARPELVAACVALVAHPDDDRYRPLVGSTVLTPLFGVAVPVLAHPAADPASGSGLTMVATFAGDADVEWWRELRLPARAVVGRDGRFLPSPPPGLEFEPASLVYDDLAGLTAAAARTRVLGLLLESGDLVGEPTVVAHRARFHERGDRPLEIVVARQWRLRTGDLGPAVAELAGRLRWHPGPPGGDGELDGDWAISRQRPHGVPFPVWYRVDDDGAVDDGAVLVPAEDRLPVDPRTDTPDGWTEDQRDRPGGFAGDPDVMDARATSSLSPLLAAGWGDDDDLFRRAYPMDLRVQGDDTGALLATVLRCHLEDGTLPWTDVVLAGRVVDGDGGDGGDGGTGAVDPMGLVEDHGADGVRCWAAAARPGADVVADTGRMAAGRRLAAGLLAVSGAVVARLATSDPAGPIGDPLDQAVVAAVAAASAAVTADLDAYDHAVALERAEALFRRLAAYVELAGPRAGGDPGAPGTRSAHRALAVSLSAVQRLLAPFLPFVAEETWSWWHEGSVHRATWPSPGELAEGGAGDPLVLDVAAEVLARVREAGTAAAVDRVVVRDTPERLAALAVAAGDIAAACGVPSLTTEEAAGFSVEVVVAGPGPPG
jgi:valyl-tRNA synthetase